MQTVLVILAVSLAGVFVVRMCYKQLTVKDKPCNGCGK